MALGAGHYFPFEASFRDHSDKVGTMRVYVIPFDPDTLADNLIQVTAFNTAIVGAVLGQEIKWSWDGEHVVNPVAIPASASAQRENKLLVRYHDSVTFKKLTATIPTINLPVLIFETDAHDFVSKTSPSSIALITTEWSSTVVNPETGNLTIVDSFEFVGRPA